MPMHDASSDPANGSDDADGGGSRPRPGPGKDAGTDVEDAGVAQRDAGDIDAASVTGMLDSGTDAAVPPQVCIEADIAAWEAFHLSSQLVSQIGSCTKTLGCTPGAPCAIDSCLRAAAGVEGCNTCASAEVTCVANECQKPCATSDEQCRACACAAGCIGQFESCAERSMSVCTMCDVNSGQCGPDPLAVELIMVVVSPLLY